MKLGDPQRWRRGYFKGGSFLGRDGNGVQSVGLEGKGEH